MPRQHQIGLRQSCEKLIDQWEGPEGVEKERLDIGDFWKYVVDFHDELDSYSVETRTQLGIENIVTQINEIYGILGVQINERNACEKKNLTEKALEWRYKIHENSQGLINKVKELRNQAQLVESKILQDIATSWAFEFLIQYYEIIAGAGKLDYIVTPIRFDVGHFSESEISIIGCIVSQAEQMAEIEPIFEKLKRLNQGFPADIKQQLLTVSDSLKVLSDECAAFVNTCGDAKKEEKILKLAKIRTVHRTLISGLHDLYKEVLTRGVKT